MFRALTDRSSVLLWRYDRGRVIRMVALMCRGIDTTMLLLLLLMFQRTAVADNLGA